MYVRASTRKNKTGQVVRYLQLAHNEWDPAAGVSRTKVLYSFGRDDQLDVPSIQRLVTALSRLLDPDPGVSASMPHVSRSSRSPLTPPLVPHQPVVPLRNDDETMTSCPVCATAFTAAGRQRYCTPACRQAAWRARNSEATTSPAVNLPPGVSRREVTVYECPDCGARHLGLQWCHDCNRPCTRIDLGGRCPHCDEPVAISDLTDQHPTGSASG